MSEYAFICNSCRLICPASLPLSQLYGEEEKQLPQVEGKLDVVQHRPLSKTKGQEFALDIVKDRSGRSVKLEQLPDEKPSCFEATALDTGKPARGHVMCVCVSSLRLYSVQIVLASVFECTPWFLSSPSL